MFRSSEIISYTKLYDHINKETRCRISTELFGRLEYRFNTYPPDKCPNGFYKFITPCTHRLYRKGDSWTEELNVDRKTFAKAFDKIGVRYKSKSDYIAACEALGNGLFKGKPYASYYERPTHMMFFIKNPCWWDHQEILKKSHFSATNSRSGMGNFPVRFYIQKKTSTLSLSLSHKKALESKTKEEIKIEEIEQPIAHQMAEIWSDITDCDKSEPLRKYRLNKLTKAYKDKFDSSLEKWRAYCTKIASSKFLMGETSSKFKLNLGFALKAETIQKMEDGYYTTGDKKIIISQSVVEKLIVKEIQEIENIAEPELIKKFRFQIIKSKGIHHYKSWIKPCQIKMRPEATLVIEAPMRFFADWLKGPDWHDSLIRATHGLFETILIFEPSLLIPYKIIDWEREKHHRLQHRDG